MLFTKSVINIAMEATAACFILLLLAVCLSQKKKDGILAHRENLREEAGLVRVSHRRELRCLFLWWAAVIAVFASSIWTGVFYVFDEVEYGIMKPLYGLMFIVGLLPAVLNTVTTVRNRKLFGAKDACLLLAFTLAPTVGVAFDLRSDLCISYLLSALIIVVIFLGINVRRTEAALQREAALALQTMVENAVRYGAEAR